MRLNKYLADNNLASRREADALIKAGLVFVNGQKAIIGQIIHPTLDKITTKPNKNKELIYLAYHKPKGLETLKSEATGTDIINTLKLPKGVAPIGRLDKDTSGLLILTNDGRLTKKLLAPESETQKEYQITIDKKITPWLLRHLSTGLKLEDFKTKPALATQVTDFSLTLTITEGKKHQVRRMIAALGARVKTLHRLRIGSIYLGSLKSGQTRALTPEEVKTILK